MTLNETRRTIDLSPYPRPALMTGEEKESACDELLNFLLREQGAIAAFSASYEKKCTLIRRLMNTRMALPLPRGVLELQDRLFWTETVERGIAETESLSFNGMGVALWEGDIVRLGADGIVNAANSGLLGCFVPGHNCIDNAIHSFAGMQVRDDCAKLIAAMRHEEPCGGAEITRAYNLPSRYILHTVGPMVRGKPTREDRAALRSCYISCLNLAEEAGLGTVAFCCVATGVFSFPREEAAEIATGAALNWKIRSGSGVRIVFNTYQRADTEIYQTILDQL